MYTKKSILTMLMVTAVSGALANDLSVTLNDTVDSLMSMNHFENEPITIGTISWPLDNGDLSDVTISSSGAYTHTTTGDQIEVELAIAITDGNCPTYWGDQCVLILNQRIPVAYQLPGTVLMIKAKDNQGSKPIGAYVGNFTIAIEQS
jgi:hypothetical protein